MKGADPEVFVGYTHGGDIVPITGLLGGTKVQPMPVPFGALQEDNVAAEFNIDPASTEDEWVHNIMYVMEELGSRLSYVDLEIRIQASYDFPMHVLRDAGPSVMVAGCEPDLNAWELAENPRPELTTLRTAAGHIHVGIEGATRMEIAHHVRRHDLFLGVPSVLMDSDTERRQLYGRAGCFREKDYGMEYRTLSNFWLRDEAHMRWAYRNSERALAYTDEVDQVVQECIDTHNRQLAAGLVKQFNLEVLYVES